AVPGQGASGPESKIPSRGDHELRITDVSHPTLSLCLLPKSRTPAPAMIVCPGGGYQYVVFDKEGTEIAAWLNSIGIDALILKYRVPHNRTGAFQDAQRAISFVRAHASEWNIDPKRIGMIGFSAGGNLAAKASTLFNARSYRPMDRVDRFSCRPDFVVLVYPAYLEDKNGHLSPELDIKANIPPTLIIHNEDDRRFVTGSKLYHAALDRAKVNNTLVLYKTGGHGYGLRSDKDVRAWPRAAEKWLGQIGVLAEVPEISGRSGKESRSESILNFGAVGDGRTLNTRQIQAAIDQVAATGGGTVVIPRGIFVSGALFLKPGVNLFLASGATLKGSTNVADYPEMETRIEGHFTRWLPALINADKTDHLRISGAGTLDGSGAPFWKEFWARWDADPKTTNLDVKRPRLVFIENSDDVRISGITFKNSAFWNLHLYRCEDVTVENVRFEVPNGVRCPSTDGTDVDSCQKVTIRDCTYRVDDDCIALKGSKGPFALRDKDSLPVEHIRVIGCAFERGNGVVTLGSEATRVSDVTVAHCRVFGSVALVCFKLRPDTPQDYEDIHYQDITLDGTGTILRVRPWTQYFNLRGQRPPVSVVRHVSLRNIQGRFGSFGEIEGNPGQTRISDISLENINVRLQDAHLKVGGVKNLTFKNVTVNGAAARLAGQPSGGW
ncbi:MAG: glycosyl hydrolase family 28 protein, partial [Limisphaerales bacterium]